MTTIEFIAGTKSTPGAFQTDRVNIAVLILLWVGMALLVNPVGNFPQNDDWVYGQAVQALLTDGVYRFPSTSSANVGPQVFWGALFCWPFGFSFTALRISSLAAGLIGVLTLYFLIERNCRAPRVALTGAALLAVNPLYFSLSNSFMTDVPFVATQIVSLFFITRGLQRAAQRDLLIGIVFSLASILIRQVGLVLLIGLAAAYPIRFGVNLRNIGKGIIPVIIGLLTHVGYQYWLVHGARTPELSGHSDVHQLFAFAGRAWYMRQVAFSTLIYWGLFLLPLLILLVHAGIRRLTSARLGRGDYLLLAGVLVLTALTWLQGLLPPSLPNIIHAWGIGPLTLRDTYYRPSFNVPVLPNYVSIGWALIGILSLAAAGGILLCLGWLGRATLSNLRDPHVRAGSWPAWLLTVTIAAYFAVLVFLSGSLPMMDRYLLPFVPFLIVLLAPLIPSAAFRRRSSVALSALLIIVYGYFSVTATHDYLEWNRLRWIAVKALMADGKITPRQIDGGYEFNGLLAFDPHYKTQDGKSWWWVYEDTYMIASGAIPGYSELARYNFQRWFLGHPSSVVVLRKN